jgi:hypothetical protein
MGKRTDAEEAFFKQELNRFQSNASLLYESNNLIGKNREI